MRARQHPGHKREFCRREKEWFIRWKRACRPGQVKNATHSPHDFRTKDSLLKDICNFSFRYLGMLGAVYLTGSHTWADLQDTLLIDGAQTPFDYNASLDFLEKYNHNFFRLWRGKARCRWGKILRML